MATKTNKKQTKKKGVTKYDIAKLTAFVALVLSGLIWLLNGIGLLVYMGSAGSILHLIKDISLLLAIGLVAHPFAKSLGKVWYAVYWVIIIIAIFGIIFGSFGIIKLSK